MLPRDIVGIGKDARTPLGLISVYEKGFQSVLRYNTELDPIAILINVECVIGSPIDRHLQILFISAEISVASCERVARDGDLGKGVCLHVANGVCQITLFRPAVRYTLEVLRNAGNGKRYSFGGIPRKFDSTTLCVHDIIIGTRELFR